MLKKTKSEQYLLLNSPPFFILYFERTVETSNLDDQIFEIDEEIYLKILTRESYNFQNKSISKYKLIATINSPSKSHFTCSIKNPRYDDNSYMGWFFHDGLQYNGRVVSRGNFDEMLTEKPFVLFYERSDLCQD